MHAAAAAGSLPWLCARAGDRLLSSRQVWGWAAAGHTCITADIHGSYIYSSSFTGLFESPSEKEHGTSVASAPGLLLVIHTSYRCQTCMVQSKSLGTPTESAEIKPTAYVMCACA